MSAPSALAAALRAAFLSAAGHQDGWDAVADKVEALLKEEREALAQCFDDMADDIHAEWKRVAVMFRQGDSDAATAKRFAGVLPASPLASEPRTAPSSSQGRRGEAGDPK